MHPSDVVHSEKEVSAVSGGSDGGSTLRYVHPYKNAGGLHFWPLEEIAGGLEPCSILRGDRSEVNNAPS